MLVAKKSPIQGKGLFTDSPILIRTKLGEFSGERISVREARKRARRAKRIVIVELSATRAIDERVEFYAKRNIAAGEELTCDYGDSHHEGKLACGCESGKCRKFL